MQIPWDLIYKRVNDLELRLEKLQGFNRVNAQKEHARLTRLITIYNSISELENQIKSLDAVLEEWENEKNEVISSNNYILSEKDELINLYLSEKDSLTNVLHNKLQELDDAIIPADPHDEQAVFLEIRAGAGGQEAALFAADLVGMYTAYSLKKGWRVSVIDESKTDLQGIREIILHIEGRGVYRYLKFEAGVHRVQRVPKTETQGRVHTSTATVAVLPEIDEVDFTINPSDLRIDVYRASGAGGQHVNTTDSAVRITHLPTGVVVACQDERSQHKNKAKALKVLQSRIFAHEKEKQDEALGQKRKEMIGRALRSEKVRTYNFPQNRVTDHTIDLTLKKLDYIIKGDLDDIIDSLIKNEKEERKKEAFIFE